MVKFTSPFYGFRYKTIETGRFIEFNVKKMVHKNLNCHKITIELIKYQPKSSGGNNEKA